MSQLTQQPDRLSWDLVDRLHKALRISQVSVSEMAAALGVHRNTVGNYLSGKTPPDRRTRVTWAFACGLPLEWLETGQVSDDSDPDGGGSQVTRE